VRYTFRQLEVFLAVARTGSVTRAARELGLSQSAASGALAELERQFDLQLFDRVGRGVRLSDRGQALWPRAEALAEQARAVERELEGRPEVGALRVGATLTIGEYLAAPLVAEMLSRHPGARVALEIANTAQIAERVASYALDVGLVEGEVQNSELDVTRWRDDELVVIAAPDHPLARRRALGDEELCSVPWILRERGSGTRQAFDRAMAGLLPRLDVVLELELTGAIKQAVAAGLGLGCVSRLAVEDDLRRRSLAACRVTGRDLRRSLFFVRRRGRAPAAAVDAWISLCGGASASIRSPTHSRNGPARLD